MNSEETTIVVKDITWCSRLGDGLRSPARPIWLTKRNASPANELFNIKWGLASELDPCGSRTVWQALLS